MAVFQTHSCFVLFKLPSQVSRMAWIMCGTPVAQVVQEEQWPLEGWRLNASLDFVDISWLSVKIHFDLKENYRQALVPWEAGDWIWSSVAKLPVALLYRQRGTQTQCDQLLNSAFQAVLAKWLRYFTTVSWPEHPLIPFFLVWLVRFYSCTLRTSYQSLSTFLGAPESIAEPLFLSFSLHCASRHQPFVLSNLGIFQHFQMVFYSVSFNQWDIFAIYSSGQFQPLSFLLFKVMLLYFWALFISFLFIVWSVCLGLGGIHVTRGTCGGHRTAWGAGSVHFTLWVSSIEFRWSHLTARAFTHWAGLPAYSAILTPFLLLCVQFSCVQVYFIELFEKYIQESKQKLMWSHLP